MYIRGLSKLRYQRKNADANSKYQFKKYTIVFDLSISKTKCSRTFEIVPFFKFKFFRQFIIDLYNTQRKMMSLRIGGNQSRQARATRDLKLGVRVLLKLSALILASIEFCGFESKSVARQLSTESLFFTRQNFTFSLLTTCKKVILFYKMYFASEDFV